MLVLLLMRKNCPDYLNSIEKCEVKKTPPHIFCLRLQSANNQPVHSQRHIPHRHDQPPYQNETTNHTADNKVQCKQGNPSTQGATTRYDPEAHPMESKRQPTEYPEPYIVKFSVLHAGGFEDTIQDQCHGHGQYAFEEKCFDCFASCHR